MKRIESSLSDAAPLSPMTTESPRERKRYPRIPRRKLKSPVVLVALLGLLSCFGSMVAAEQGYYNEYGGYDYGGNNGGGNQYEQEKFQWPDDVGFDEVSVLPVSCIN